MVSILAGNWIHGLFLLHRGLVFAQLWDMISQSSTDVPSTIESLYVDGEQMHNTVDQSTKLFESSLNDCRKWVFLNMLVGKQTLLLVTAYLGYLKCVPPCEWDGFMWEIVPKEESFQRKLIYFLVLLWADRDGTLTNSIQKRQLYCRDFFIITECSSCESEGDVKP